MEDSINNKIDKEYSDFKSDMKERMGKLESLVNERFDSRDRAREVFEKNLRDWQHQSNEWRKENADQRSLFVSKSEVKADLAEAKSERLFLISTEREERLRNDNIETLARQQLETRIIFLEKLKDEGTGKSYAFNIIWAVALSAISAIGTIVTVIILLNRLAAPLVK